MSEPLPPDHESPEDALPREGQRSQCRWCGNVIERVGGKWRHFFAHEAVPDPKFGYYDVPAKPPILPPKK